LRGPAVRILIVNDPISPSILAEPFSQGSQAVKDDRAFARSPHGGGPKGRP